MAQNKQQDGRSELNGSTLTVATRHYGKMHLEPGTSKLYTHHSTVTVPRVLPFTFPRYERRRSERGMGDYSRTVMDTAEQVTLAEPVF